MFAAVLATVLAALLSPSWRQRGKLALMLFAITVSHDVLDAFTNGGLGVAFFAPFDLQRYFFPWRPIEVSPFSIHRLLSARGAAVLRSEFLWVWIPCLFMILASWTVRKWHARALSETKPDMVPPQR